ncbi:low-density lipoprotein receptor-related protein 2-like [Daphnia carinata]|uniref:low-density lipoprotein receptor-related protein 2-like n=1 Tax=Daphnia carinata TaxID=120202 RepID=UPI00257D6939|nr:low-density lipoprotein receptor-related protein 2-like [Daphnia carinata]
MNGQSFFVLTLMTVGLSKGKLVERQTNRAERYTLEHNDISSTRYLGEACVSSGACRRGNRDSVCHHGVCTCLPFHMAQNATTCLPTALLGFECFANSQCSLRVPNSGCIDGTCQCSRGYTPYRRHLCLPPARLGHKCFGDDQCRLSDKHSYCKFIIPNVYGRCYCDETAEHFGQSCIKPRLAIGSRCSSSAECKAHIKNSLCHDSTCVCDYGFTIGWTDNRCVATLKGLNENQLNFNQKASIGQPCTSWAQCQAADFNSGCIDGYCQCIAGEAQCGRNNTGCHPLTFQCRSSGRCISRSLTCNGHADCEDASDEIDCRRRPCPTGSFPCGAHCISGMFICDGIQHCADGSDEDRCQVEDGEDCPGNSFKCNDGTCVPEHAFCNSIVDCSDGSDEPEQACKREYRKKKSDEYCPVKCGNGRCRSAAVLCTGQDGCGDNTDEKQCEICRCPTIVHQV